MNFIKKLKICSTKDPVKKMKRQCTVCEKRFAKHNFYREFIYSIYEELAIPEEKIKTQNTAIRETLAEILLTTHRLQANVQRYSMSLAIWEIHIKSTMN